MRRQSKPFVTEYKSSPRRIKDNLDSDSLTEVASAPDHVRADPFRADARLSGSDDGYDAALRAADALFSPKPRAAPSPTDESETGVPTPAAERPGGRILQAIEETPADRFAELEALHAPKRRGRKPGSKNKPKPAIAAAETHAGIAPTPPSPAPLRATPPSPIAPRAVVAALQTTPAVVASRRGERFAWVRTTLRPGERWKRRLPKVAW